VLASDGQSLIEGFASVAGKQGSVGRSQPIRDGSVVLWLDRPRAVEVRATGCTPRMIPDMFVDTTVTLERN
jgi:hypothetical protein